MSAKQNRKAKKTTPLKSSNNISAYQSTRCVNKKLVKSSQDK